MPIATLDQLKEQIGAQGALSAANRQISRFVVAHLREVSLMSATELADACGISQASVSRFCMGLGYTGFAEFVRTLQDMVREEWSAPDRVHFLHSPPSAGSDPLLQEEIANVTQLQILCSSPEAESLVQFTLRAPRLILASTRASATLLPYAGYFFSKVRDRVEIATPDTALWTALASHPQHDVAILVLAFPRYANVLLEWLKDVAHWATPIAAITDRPQSPVRNVAHPLVVVPVARTSLFDSYAAPIVFLNYLIRQAAAQTPDITARLQALEQYEAAQQIYYQ